MRIADVCAFYTPAGGGVRTYIEAKLKAAARFGHEMVVVAPGERHEIIRRGPGAVLVTIPSPRLPLDRRYRYFDDEAAVHAVLDAWQPDHVEASSPWSSATMVGRWPSPASRSLVMHSDPLAAYAYRWLGGIAPTHRIDRCFGWFWRHLRGLGRMFDTVVCANAQLAGRLHKGGLTNCETVPMGVEAGVFSPAHRSSALRDQALGALGLDAGATLLIGIGRFSAEKRWDMVLRAVGDVARRRKIGMLLVGDGPRRASLELLAERIGAAAVLPRIEDRDQLAQLLASADVLVHGCEAETFCMVAAEARASGVPMIVPNRGAAIDQLVPGGGRTYRAASQVSLERAIGGFVERGPELQRAAAVRSSGVRTMDEHFAELFARYEMLAPRPVTNAVGRRELAVGESVGELALARSAAPGS
jgi:alpha-1,6-mannosyltransferase